MPMYLAGLCLRLVSHVIKKLLRPVYEGLYVQAVIRQSPPAVLAVATKAALQSLHKPANSAIPTYCGRQLALWASHRASSYQRLDTQGMMPSMTCIHGTAEVASEDMHCRNSGAGLDMGSSA